MKVTTTNDIILDNIQSVQMFSDLIREEKTKLAKLHNEVNSLIKYMNKKNIDKDVVIEHLLNFKDRLLNHCKSLSTLENYYF